MARLRTLVQVVDRLHGRNQREKAEYGDTQGEKQWLAKITSQPSSGKSKLNLYKFDIAIGSASKTFGLKPAFLINLACSFIIFFVVEVKITFILSISCLFEPR